MTLAYSPYRMPSNDHAHSYPEGRGGGAELVTPDGRALPLESVRLAISAGGGIARAVLEQTFTNDSDETLHLTYRMPLPADGAVSGYAFQVGARTIEGKVEPRSAARAHFEQAILDGKTAAILDQEKADIFTQEIGNVPARTRIVTRITVDQRLTWLPEGEWELRFPTVIGPRYTSESATQKVRDAVAIEVSEAAVSKVSVEVRVRDTLTRPASSSSHKLRGERILEAEGTLDRDLVVRWGVAEPEVGLSVIGGGRHALLTIVPPLAPKEVTSRDLIVLLDTSGSMGGGPLSQAKKIVAALIGSLGKDDRLELVEFSNAPRRWQEGAVFVADAQKKSALSWLAKLEASGSTEMATAVKSALSALRPTAQRQVVLVTDGYIGGEEEILRILHDALPAQCRFHVVGVGSAPNRVLSMALARAGRGAEILAAPGEDVERPIRRLLDRTESPVLTELVVEGGAVLETAPRAIPDVFAGSPVVVGLVIGRGAIVVRGLLAGRPWERTVQAPLDEESPAIAALYGRERVADLEILTAMGRDPESTERTIESLGVEYQIATRLTSWVAIDEQKSVDPRTTSRRVSIPQELPHGTVMASFGLAAPMMPMQMASADLDDYTMVASRSTKKREAPPPMAQPRPLAAPARPSTMRLRKEAVGGAYGGAPPAPGRAAGPSTPTSVSAPAPARDAGAEPQLQAAQPAPMKRSRRSRFAAILLLLAILIAALIYWFFGR